MDLVQVHLVLGRLFICHLVRPKLAFQLFRLQSCSALADQLVLLGLLVQWRLDLRMYLNQVKFSPLRSFCDNRFEPFAGISTSLIYQIIK